MMERLKEYKVKDFMTTLTIRKISQQNVIEITESLEKDLNDTQKIIVAEIIKNSKITQKQLAKIIGINERNIRNNIDILKSKRIIVRIGSDKGGHC